MIYIYKNNQRSGPFEENVVLDQLNAGLLSADDLAVRHGETQWQPLGAMFPNIGAPQPARPVQFTAAAEMPAFTATATDPEPQFRNTIVPKAFFGLCLLVALVGFAAVAFYFYTLMSPTGNLEADLSRVSFKVLARNFAGGVLVGGFFVFLALLVAFKRKLIQSSGLRIALRAVFILVMLIGLGSFAGGAISYLTYSAPYKSSSKASETNELLKALEDGEAATGPYETAVIFLPIGAGLFLFGLSGVLMAKKPNS
ncbi:MAG: DUF4339 domain-containing protein [Pyrinomonadaceae bacterium]